MVMDKKLYLVNFKESVADTSGVYLSCCRLSKDEDSIHARFYSKGKQNWLIPFSNVQDITVLNMTNKFVVWDSENGDIARLKYLIKHKNPMGE